MKEKITFTEKSQSTDKTFLNPFPGLRPFNIEDSHLFFGREGQSDELLKKLAENRFVGVIGASGSGKSSLMFCGLVPTLQGGFITKAGSNWKIVTTRPGGGPIENLANALLKNEFTGVLNEEEPIIKRALTQAVLRNSSRGLVEAVKQLDRGPDENILLLVDQFEELFRFKKSRKDSSSANESAAFVKLLLEAVKQTEVPIYVVMTMRSDFIGDCSQFPELTQKINDSHYLIPQMTRANLHEAITGPVAVAGGQIAPRLIQQLLNDVGDNPDQLPILQHALMRTWDYWQNNHEVGEPMDADHYEAIGKMEKALSEHANEAFDELSDSGKKICEALFKAITEKGSDSRGIRHPEKVAAIASICEAPDDEVVKVVESFRKPGRSFLTPSVEVVPQIHSEAIIDISHESLMRIWDRLKTWVEEEASSVQMYQRLSEAAAMYQLGKTSLWRPPDLLIAQNWKEKQQPTLTWAQRYNPAYERTMVFLGTSIKEYETEEQNKVRLQKRTLKRARIVTIIVSLAALVSIGLMVYSFQLQIEADKQKELAVVSAEEAKKEKAAADIQRVKAQEKEKEAKKAAEEAEKQTLLAKKQEELARQSAEEAEKQKRIALQQSAFAKQQANLAQKEKTKAEANFVEANKQKQKAEEANALALNRQMQSISKTMALKSVQVNKDPDQKGLMAYQAYQFNERFQGNTHSPEIYDGLYYALKLTNDDDYNSLKGHKDGVRSMAFVPNGNTMYSAGSDGKILKWDINNPKAGNTVIAENPFINRVVTVSPNGQLLACGGEKPFIQLFDLNDPKAEPKKLIGHKDAVWALAYTPDSKYLVSTGADTTILLWDLASATSSLIAKTNSRVLGMAIDPKGKMIAGATEDGSLTLWTGSGKAYTSSVLFEQKKNPIYSVVFSTDGNYIAAGDQQGVVRIWDVRNPKEVLNTLVGYNARIIDIKFSPDGKMLAGACYDGSIQLWQMENLNEQPIVLKDNKSWVMSMDFSPDGKNLIAGCMSGLIRVYPTGTKAMAEQMCAKLKRNMSKKEWADLVSKDIQYEKTCGNLPAGDGVEK